MGYILWSGTWEVREELNLRGITCILYFGITCAMFPEKEVPELSSQDFHRKAREQFIMDSYNLDWFPHLWLVARIKLDKKNYGIKQERTDFETPQYKNDAKCINHC